MWGCRNVNSCGCRGRVHVQVSISSIPICYDKYVQTIFFYAERALLTSVVGCIFLNSKCHVFSSCDRHRILVFFSKCMMPRIIVPRLLPGPLPYPQPP